MCENQQLKATDVKINNDDLIYLINEQKKTAGVIDNKNAKGDIIIPRSIYYKSNEYIVTSILSQAFHDTQLKSIRFSENSDIQIINNSAFFNSAIESLTIPSSLVDLREGWCSGTSKLKTIKVDPENPRYSNYDENLIIGKSSLETSNFDVIIFCNRKAKKVKIPKFIKHIGSYAFHRCKQLHQLEIPSDSELQTFSSHSFFNSSIESISIPPHLTQINESSFSQCSQLKEIIIPADSELQIIGQSAFYKTSIERFTISRHIAQIDDCAFFESCKLKEIEIPIDSELKTIGKKAFYKTEIESLMIPSSIIELKQRWCSGASKLMTVKVDPNNKRYSNYDDNLIIGKSSFVKTSNFDTIIFCNRNVEKVTIPNFIRYIEPFAFSKCKQLHQLEIPSDSKLETIYKNAFSHSSIESLSIPPHLTKVCQYAFSNCKQLKTIEVPADCDLQIIEKYAFFKTSIKSFTVSRHLKQINEYAFSNCIQLKDFEIPNDSELEVICKFAFNNTVIESLNIPSRLTNFCSDWCVGTPQLAIITVDPNNERYSSYNDKMIIGKSSLKASNYDDIIFCNRNVEEVTIPNFIKRITTGSFDRCNKLKEIVILKDSNLEVIEYLSFYNASIESLFIPSSLIELKAGWCVGTTKLTKIEIDPNNKKYLKYNDDMIIGKQSLFESINYDEIIFCNRNIIKITIPNFIKKINVGAFDNCKRLQKVEFSNHSELEIIEEFAFNVSTIERFTLPSHLTLINAYAFNACIQLRVFEINEDSKLQKINDWAFMNTSIKSFFIPRYLDTIGKNAFSNCNNLQIIEVDEYSEMKCFHANPFKDCKNVVIMIPTKLNYHFKID